MRRNGSPTERMKEILSALGISSNDFENRCGMGHGFVARVTHVITKKNRAKIKMAFPTINLDYVTKGIGEMFVTEDTTPLPTIKERIRKFCDIMQMPDTEFCRKSGLAESFLKNMSDSVRWKSLEKIYKAFPTLNPSWLEYGEGDMITDKKLKIKKEAHYERIDQLIEFLGITKTQFETETGTSGNYASLRKDITKKTADKITKRYPFVNPIWLMHGDGQMIAAKPKPVMSKLSFAPLVTQRAYAGYLHGFADDEYVDELEKVPYIENEDTKGNIIAFEVSGDSMDNGTPSAYLDGDIVLCRELNITDYQNMHLPFKHYDFVIIHKEGILIKQIKDHNLSTGDITIHSLNSFYGDIVIGIADIHKIFVIITKISKMRR